MPNTLAHIGVGGVASRILFRDVDAKWIYIGCIIPDIPWIIQRQTSSLLPGIDLIDLRLYAIVQASLFFGLILSGAIALMARSCGRIFLLLGFNCLVHLALDAGQIKWANGVHFLAPFSWQLSTFGLFWPESGWAYGLTGIGLGFFIWTWSEAWQKPVDFLVSANGRAFTGAGLLLLYLLLPLLLIDGPPNADNHYTATLRNVDTRAGKPISFDRCQYDPDTRSILIFSGEKIGVTGVKWPRAATISILGRFTTSDQIEVSETHIHHWFRDFGSFLGLALIAFLWFTSGWKKRINLKH